MDVNDETPLFDKELYEFILTTDLKNFTIPAFIHATDADAEPPNNVVHYEIIHGNYQNKFALNEVSGQLTLRETLIRGTRNKRQTKNENDMDIFVLTARAFDLGVPLRYSTTTVRIYPPESRTRAISFLVPGYHPDRAKLQEMLSDMTGGRVIIQDIRPYLKSDGPPTGPNGEREEKSIVTATVNYDGESFIDVMKIQERLIYASNANNNGVAMNEEKEVRF